MRTSIEKLTWPNHVVKVYNERGVMEEMHFTYTAWGAKRVEKRILRKGKK